jgi:hypothetical protein
LFQRVIAKRALKLGDDQTPETAPPRSFGSARSHKARILCASDATRNVRLLLGCPSRGGSQFLLLDRLASRNLGPWPLRRVHLFALAKNPLRLFQINLCPFPVLF